ncbi:hypothetical protein M728_001878 [Ensifer sp. WSM1721]|uniref:hypothetical protein n=1 Tax=Ensifer sp. WSM1721 TaxID=1041159 RepID=UPI0004792B0B|nr:hypothetical protein [Ensifer sp. WSM1721]
MTSPSSQGAGAFFLIFQFMAHGGLARSKTLRRRVRPAMRLRVDPNPERVRKHRDASTQGSAVQASDEALREHGSIAGRDGLVSLTEDSGGIGANTTLLHVILKS